MRIRLRAPDNGDATLSASTTVYDVDSPTHNGMNSIRANADAFTTPKRLPQLDLRSPEYIEERLENLKRRPSWGSYLDQYVSDHPESDESDEDADEMFAYKIDNTAKASTMSGPGLIRSTLWAVVVIAFTPLLVLCYPCVRHKGKGFWPLGCRTMQELYRKAITNLYFTLFSLVLTYWAICREFPELDYENALIKLSIRWSELLKAAQLCEASIVQWETTMVQELCMPVGIDGVLILVNAVLLLHNHRTWARVLMIVMAGVFVLDVPTKLYIATFPSPDIEYIDPSFALLDEELLVEVSGKNLKPGGSIAWVSYWGCAVSTPVNACEKQFHSVFDMGVVPVTFTSIDHFIPCYRDPPNPLKAQEYECFEHVRIRVKGKQSIPGWSKQTAQSVQQTLPAENNQKEAEEKPRPTQRETIQIVETVKTVEIVKRTEPKKTTEVDPSTASLSDTKKASKISRHEKSKRRGNTVAVDLNGDVA